MFSQDDYQVRVGLGRLPSWGARSQGSQFQTQRRPGHDNDIGDHDVDDDDYDDDVGSEATVMSRPKWESPEANQGDCFRRNIGRDPRTQ